MTTTTRTTSHVRLPRAQRREQLVRAAAASFLAGGYDKTSMEDVARAAGVTRLIVYRIFESKEALYIAVLDSVLDDMAASFGADGDLPVRRDLVTATLLGVARRHPDAFRLLWQHAANQAEFAAVFEQFRSGATEFTVALLADFVDDPVIRQWGAETLVSHLHEGICLWLAHGEESRDEEFLGLLASGVRATVLAWSEALRP